MRFVPILLLSLIITTNCITFETAKSEEFDQLSTIKYQCSFFENWSIFSYKPIENKIADEDFKAPIIEDGITNTNIYFSFCNDANIPCSNKPEFLGSAIVKNEDTGECTLVSSDKWDDVRVVYVENDLDKSRDYLRLSWENGDPCPFNDQGWEFSIDVVCSDVDIDNSRYFYTGGFSDRSCRVRTQFESKLG